MLLEGSIGAAIITYYSLTDTRQLFQKTKQNTPMRWLLEALMFQSVGYELV